MTAAVEQNQGVTQNANTYLRVLRCFVDDPIVVQKLNQADQSGHALVVVQCVNLDLNSVRQWSSHRFFVYPWNVWNSILLILLQLVSPTKWHITENVVFFNIEQFADMTRSSVDCLMSTKNYDAAAQCIFLGPVLQRMHSWWGWKAKLVFSVKCQCWALKFWVFWVNRRWTQKTQNFSVKHWQWTEKPSWALNPYQKNAFFAKPYPESCFPGRAEGLF